MFWNFSVFFNQPNPDYEFEMFPNVLELQISVFSNIYENVFLLLQIYFFLTGKSGFFLRSCKFVI